MQKVITINLNGNAYQLDESGYDALRAYLEHADAQLAGNPDRAEIVRDLEQSIAEKCMRFLGPGKSVVSATEVEQILRDIGPVDAGAASSQTAAQPPPREASDAAAATTHPRRLYQIREGGMLSGVCNGLGAYFNVDPTIVRVALVIGAVLEVAITDDPPWITVMFYVLLVFVVPYAKTSEQLAAAQGSSEAIPYRVHEIVERVKAKVVGLHHKAR
jgi:phage shock protein PspC (stress-responsive transcriptional regulator)